MNNRKAFTLIELIAVLVILAVVSLIVVPLILNTIRNVKTSINKRSVDGYGRAVEYAMANYQLVHLTYPTNFDELEIEYTGSVIECETRRINPDYTIYLDECKVNGNKVDYHYGTLVLTDKEYVDKLGSNIELALKDYHDEHNSYPINYRLLDLPELDKDVNCVSEIHQDGTVYLTKCNIDGNYILNENEEDGYYHYGKEILTAVKYLLKKTNGIEITNYTDGNTHEMYTFEHDETVQTPALTDYRYIGNDPYNYVRFNNGLWRIVGVFSVEDENGKWEERIKLISNDTIGNKQWNSDSQSEWVGSTMQLYLNETYSLNQLSNSMVAASKYYLGGKSGLSGNGVDFYASERSKITYNSNRSTNWVGNIALMYPSDYAYTYALGVDSICYSTINGCKTDNGATPSLGWIYNQQYTQWTLTSRSGYATSLFYVSRTGYASSYNASASHGTRPVLYLKPNVKIKSGDGTIDSPYELSMN